MLGMGKEGRAEVGRMFEGERVTKTSQTGPMRWTVCESVHVCALL